MSAQEEIDEHVHHARDLFEKLVAGNMAIVAALLAIVSVLGQHYNTEELLKQQESSDQWAYYQAKNIRLYIAQSTQDLIMAAGRAGGQSSSRYQQDAVRYKREESGIQDKAHELERERDADGRKAHQFHIGEVFLEVAIVLLSLAILTRRRPLAFAGLTSAIAGVVWAANGFFP
ncbi:MAG: DUF4337 domain-containing protein [Bryobacteraceae bacterium]